MKYNYRALTPVGKCEVCGINLWAEHNGEPAIWPCGLTGCPYPDKSLTKFEHSFTGSSLSFIPTT